MVAAETIRVEVVYALPGNACLLSIEVPAGTTIGGALERSGILQRFPEIDLDKQKVGIFSQERELDTILEAGDRVEIYRPLHVDPKEARRRRAGENHEHDG